MGELIGLIIFGAVIGALARLVMKGDQNIGIIWTIVLGALGALVGYWLAGLLGVGQTNGIDWIRWIISIVAAVVFISIYIGIRGGGRKRGIMH
ncbi:GlsB/YeaQ/YmgE family stress response membrane protein [Georgenia thermotolerans]|uniref:GlsB/YeaQ/YmgE family stress response membrane protein n=1 Tax=Georgenia thermotolerans TaxID=527326 RepID=A0A7J5UL90_9MICO|nr:GlsB/YeaQ/YmgE family stress response membrane protein [Georgenia thermotolerans]